MKPIDIKVNDVYDFRFKEELAKKMFEPYHCFDGQLIAKQSHDGALILEDTYWGSSGGNKKYTISDAQELGTLTFKCNLDEVEIIKRGDLQYYSDSDLFDLSQQHSCYPKYGKKKGAEKSKEKMAAVIAEKIASAEHNIESANRDIIRLKATLSKIESGELEGVYI
jgi:hypothetical protein